VTYNYFAYGSNMDEDDLARWCRERKKPLVKFLSIAPVKLDGYKLCFNYCSSSRKSGAANIMNSKDDCAYGLLAEIKDSDLSTIREKEGCPNFYREIAVDLDTFGGLRITGVLTYKAVEQREKVNHQPPTQYYLNLIIRNAEKYGFPHHYIEYLKSIECINSNG